ncbi:MAG: phosphonate ABC transporter, permease protein PhnE [Acetobacteraceae bacterium]|nr:phosphonate ABC transporter, permease protein PhnE [Acetobacteraceae bacterium]
MGVAVAVIALALFSGWLVGADPALLARRLPVFFSYFDRIFTLDGGARAWTDPREWFWGLRRWLRLLGDTLLIAYVGTFLGAAGGFFLSFASAANLVSNRWLRGTAKRFLEFCRTVPDIVFALIFVVAFGLGPVPGVLALLVHTVGALGKQMSEVIENADRKPIEGLTAVGASWPAMVRFAVVPQILPNFASYALLRLEINVREASVLGFVGAGGIGQDLMEAIRKFYYADVSAILLLLIGTVMLIDLGTERVRHHLMGAESRA